MRSFRQMWPFYWHLKPFFVFGPSYPWPLEVASQKQDEGRSGKKEEGERARRERQKTEEATRSALHGLSVLQQLRRQIFFDASSHVPLCSFSGTVCAVIIGLSSAP